MYNKRFYLLFIFFAVPYFELNDYFLLINNNNTVNVKFKRYFEYEFSTLMWHIFRESKIRLVIMNIYITYLLLWVSRFHFLLFQVRQELCIRLQIYCVFPCLPAIPKCTKYCKNRMLFIAHNRQKRNSPGSLVMIMIRGLKQFRIQL